MQNSNYQRNSTYGTVRKSNNNGLISILDGLITIHVSIGFNLVPK